MILLLWFREWWLRLSQPEVCGYCWRVIPKGEKHLAGWFKAGKCDVIRDATIGSGGMP